jgi:PIN domain nuclease of toxin-antitoxin system
VTYLLDTCSLIWHIGDAGKFSPHVLAEIKKPETVLFGSYVSLIEIAAKVGSKRLTFSEPLETFLPNSMEKLRILRLPLTLPEIFHLAKLPNIHKDPFDRLLISQALRHDMPVITPDPNFPPYGVKVLW